MEARNAVRKVVSELRKDPPNPPKNNSRQEIRKARHAPVKLFEADCVLVTGARNVVAAVAYVIAIAIWQCTLLWLNRNRTAGER